MILAAADDISGAAEIAAVGHHFGLTAQVQMEVAGSTSSDLVVVDTDTRYTTGDPGRDIMDALAGFAGVPVEWHYKKVDSVLRGNVVEELCAMMRILRKERTILAPANPTKARVISNGQYFIRGRPLHETEFANDPEFPAASSRIVDLLHAPASCRVQVRTWKNHSSGDQGIIVAEAESIADLVQWSEFVDEHTLAAGGADFFTVLLEKRLVSRIAPRKIDAATVPGKKLFVCGSASDKSRRAVAEARDLGVSVCAMPDALFDDAPTDDALLRPWADCILEALSASGRAITAILQPVVQNPKLAQSLRMKTAAMVQSVVREAAIGELLIEGGATAEAVLHGLRWQRLDVVGQYAPGVVQMRVAGPPGHYVTIKPGSYTWPKRIWWI